MLLLGNLAGEGRRRFAGSDDQRDRLTHRHHVARARGHVAQDPRRRCLDLDGDLVGLDLDDRLALPHQIPRRLEPVQDLAGLLRQLERRHGAVGGHSRARLRVSSSQLVRGSTTSAPRPTSSSSLAAPSATATMLLVATMVTSVPARFTSATPKGIVYSSAGTGPLTRYIILSSKMTTGLSSRMAV